MGAKEVKDEGANTPKAAQIDVPGPTTRKGTPDTRTGSTNASTAWTSACSGT